MKSEIQIKNSAGVCRIEIEGTIGVPEEWQFDQPEARVATYEKFRDTVRRIAGIDAPQIVVDIRSTGGDVNDALLIHDALRSLDAHITTRCYGYTASAATIIAQAASPGCREISANALYLIHTAICAAEGNAAEIAGKLDLLRQTDTRIAAVYAARSGRPAGEFEALMAENNGNGRWLSPEEAVAAGLADTVTDNGERTAPSLAGNIARGWERLLAGIGLNRREELPADRNVLLTAGERQELLRRSATAIRQAQQNASRRPVVRRYGTDGEPTRLRRRRQTLQRHLTFTHDITQHQKQISHEFLRKCKTVHRFRPRNHLFPPDPERRLRPRTGRTGTL